MTTKSILLAVADPQVLIDVTQALGPGWDACSVACEADALAQLEQRPFDALLADFNLGSPDASELLNQALLKSPETIRFLLAYEPDLALVAAKVEGSPQILPKPIEPDSLKSRVEEAVAGPESSEAGTEPINGLSASPTVPPIYAEVLKAIESPGVTSAQVGAVIARDSELTAEVLKLTDSSYLGLPRNITEPVAAVESLGLPTIKALVLALQFLAEHRRLKASYLSLDQLWAHSISVAQIARDLVLFETKDRVLAAQALTAGLLHDLGKVVLATNFDDLYGRVHSLARKQPVSLWDVEKEMFGANHGEIGGCLVGMWNMPTAVVEAAALHHEPPLGEQQELTPLAAVHIANVLEHQLRTANQDFLVAPVINTPFLSELGLLQRLPVWRAAFTNRRSVELDPELLPDEPEREIPLTSAAPSRTANQWAAPEGATRTATFTREPAKQNESSRPTRPARIWVYAGAVAGILALLAFWLDTRPEPGSGQPVYARTPASERAPASEPEPPAPSAVAEQSPTAASSALPSVSQPVAGRPPVEQAPVAVPAATVPAPAPQPAVVPALAVTNTPPPVLAEEKRPLPEFRLNGIFYRSVRPSAIVNGQTVNIGDEVEGATVVAIGRTTVTLQINGHRKTYELR